jgi:hypothetical protein
MAEEYQLGDTHPRDARYILRAKMSGMYHWHLEAFGKAIIEQIPVDNTDALAADPFKSATLAHMVDLQKNSIPYTYQTAKDATTDGRIRISSQPQMMETKALEGYNCIMYYKEDFTLSTPWGVDKTETKEGFVMEK